MPKEKSKIQEVSIVQNKGNFSIFKKPGSPKPEYNFKDISDLRHLFGKEKAKILHTVKTKNPSSIYELSKVLGRNFRSVSEDVKLLKKFGLIELKPEQTKKRKRLKPVAAVDSINIHIKI